MFYSDRISGRVHLYSRVMISNVCLIPGELKCYLHPRCSSHILTLECYRRQIWGMMEGPPCQYFELVQVPTLTLIQFLKIHPNESVPLSPNSLNHSKTRTKEPPTNVIIII